MPTYFLDSSALVKRYRQEEGTPAVLELLKGDHRFIIARLAQVEVSSAISRRGRAAGFSSDQLQAVFSVLDREVNQLFEVVELTGEILRSAVDLSRLHSLRAADALQLAGALHVHLKFPQEFFLVSTDHELNVAAVAEHLSVIDLSKS